MNAFSFINLQPFVAAAAPQKHQHVGVVGLPLLHANENEDADEDDDDPNVWQHGNLTLKITLFLP